MFTPPVPWFDRQRVRSAEVIMDPRLTCSTYPVVFKSRVFGYFPTYWTSKLRRFGGTWSKFLNLDVHQSFPFTKHSQNNLKIFYPSLSKEILGFSSYKDFSSIIEDLLIKASMKPIKWILFFRWVLKISPKLFYTFYLNYTVSHVYKMD